MPGKGVANIRGSPVCVCESDGYDWRSAWPEAFIGNLLIAAPVALYPCHD